MYAAVFAVASKSGPLTWTGPSRMQTDDLAICVIRAGQRLAFEHQLISRILTFPVNRMIRVFC